MQAAHDRNCEGPCKFRGPNLVQTGLTLSTFFALKQTQEDIEIIDGEATVSRCVPDPSVRATVQHANFAEA